ncbi:phage holin family protein [Bacteroides fragilis]|uniref:phage holin family protein n=1 Tax=Bacteroides fragilis TaxID=817 RepID=UPI0034A3A46C
MDIIIKSFLEHLQRILSTVYGWLSTVIIFIAHFFAPAWYPFAVVGILILIDLGWGIAVSLKKGEFAYSEVGRETCKKVAIYASCLCSVYMIEQIFHTSVAVTSVAAGLAGACEVWSFSASILIIAPNFPFISLFRAQLRGEMERKLGRNINDILK